MTAPNDDPLKQTTPSILDSIKSPADLRCINARHLQQVADELRAETINAVAVTGGHLGASLGVIELTVALHYILAPNDKVDLGRRSPGLSAHRPAGVIALHFAHRRRPVGIHEAIRANTMRSAQRIPRPRYPPDWAWRWRAIFRSNIM
jgi:hypothetical protein